MFIFLLISLIFIPSYTLAASSSVEPAHIINLKVIQPEEKHRLGKFFLVTAPKATAKDAIFLLTEVALEKPLHKDTLTLLGAAYYWAENYDEASKFLRRALAVNKEDEIAWLVYGVAQLRSGEDLRGIEALKGGLTLLNRAATADYRGSRNWDRQGVVRKAMRRAVLMIAKEFPKDRIIESVENLLLRINEEEAAQNGQSWIVYERSKYGFAISLPPTWLLFERPQLADTTLTVLNELNPEMGRILGWEQNKIKSVASAFSATAWPASQDSFVSVDVALHDLPIELTLDDLMKVALTVLEATNLVQKPISNRKVTLGSGDARQFQYIMKLNTLAGQTTCVISNYMILKERKLYQLVHVSTADRAEKDALALEKIAQSFRWSD